MSVRSQRVASFSDALSTRHFADRRSAGPPHPHQQSGSSAFCARSGVAPACGRGMGSPSQPSPTHMWASAFLRRSETQLEEKVAHRPIPWLRRTNVWRRVTSLRTVTWDLRGQNLQRCQPGRSAGRTADQVRPAQCQRILRASRWILPRHRQSLQKSLNRSGAMPVYLTVC